MKTTSNLFIKKPTRMVVLTVLAVVIVVSAVALWMCYQMVQAEAYARYVGIRNVSAEKIAKVVRGVEMNAKNIFEEVGRHLDTPESVIAALEGEATLNYDVRGYFAAFEPNFFPEEGTWFEPYIYQPDAHGFEYKQVGSARHNYTKSPWYVQAKSTGATFWSKPYYYYDGTSMSGHYSTFVKPIYDEKGQLACVCGADMKFEWLSEELKWVDDTSRANHVLNKYHEGTQFDFYTVIFDDEGTCIAHPNDKGTKITDKRVLTDFEQRKSGIVDMDINGVPCTVYYGPIEFVDWTVAIIVPKFDIVKELIPTAVILLLLDIVGIFIVWFVCRKARKYEKAG